MTNKPMLSVERELLEDFADYAEKGKVAEPCMVEKLRALLDADKVNSREMGLMQYVEAHPIKPAAQHQGEPVAYQIRRRTDRDDSAWTKWQECSEMERAMHSHEVGKYNRFGIMREIRALYAEQPAPLKIGSGVTVENIGFGSEQERKPYLVFDGGGFLTEVNLIDVSLVSKRQAHTIADLEAIGVRVEQPASVAVAVAMPDNESAAKKLAECMDYPWEHMTEKGRENMRNHAKGIINAASRTKSSI